LYNDASFTEDDDVVGFASAPQAVGDEYDGSALAEGAGPGEIRDAPNLIFNVCVVGQLLNRVETT
jgi:hypothetical protein